MFNVRLAGGHLYEKQLFTWLSLMVSLMASFVLLFFPLDDLDEMWDLIESVSEGYLILFIISVTCSTLYAGDFISVISSTLFAIDFVNVTCSTLFATDFVSVTCSTLFPVDFYR